MGEIGEIGEFGLVAARGIRKRGYSMACRFALRECSKRVF